MPPRAPTSTVTPFRPVLYQLGRVDERFVPGDAPIDLSTTPRPLIIGRGEAGAAAPVGRVLVDDPWMSSRHARLVDGPARSGQPGAPARLFVEDLGSKNGVLVNGVGAPKTPLLHGDIVETGRTFWVYVEERGEPVAPSTGAVEVGAFVTWQPRLGAQLQELLTRARGDEHAIIVGEDGTGKGFLARTLHQISHRAGRFLHLDCAERRPRKIAVDLFGKDGVTGRLRDAAGGTLLLEHIEVLPLELQARLADVLQRRSLARDGKSSFTVEARVLATISVSPEQLIKSGALDPALLAALSGIRVDLPPLADRLCDLGLLLDDFITRAKGATTISREACRVLFRHRFAQHVRGFARVVEAAASLAVDDDSVAAGAPQETLDTSGRLRGGTIDVQHLPFSVAGLDAVRAMIARANQLAADHDDHTIGQTSTEIPALSLTGDDVAVDDDDDGAAHADLRSSDGFSSTIETDAERQRPPLTSARRPATVSVLDAGVFAEPDEIDADALLGALQAARGNVSVAARALGRPRALVLRWMRDLNLDPLSYR